MKIKNILLYTLITLLFVMCAPRRAVVVSDPLPPPMWGPVGYNNVRYYYMPDMMVYYDIHTGMFIYPRGNRWISRSYLPGYYSSYDLYTTYVVVIDDYYGPSPYQYFNMHRQRYAVGYRGPSQQRIGRRVDDGRNYYAPSRNRTPRTPQTSATSGRSVQQNSGRATGTTQGRTTTTEGRTPSSQSAGRSSQNTIRDNSRMNQQDAEAVRQRTNEIRQQSSPSPRSRATQTTPSRSNTTAPSRTSSPGRSTSPATNTRGNSGGRG